MKNSFGPLLFVICLLSCSLLLVSLLLGCAQSGGGSATTTTVTTSSSTTSSTDLPTTTSTTTTTTTTSSSVSSSTNSSTTTSITTSTATTTTVTTTTATTTSTTTHTTTTTSSIDAILQYTIYPDTSAAPQLTFYWGASRETVVPPSVTSISSRYGGWEGSGGGVFKAGCEPASESEMIFSTTREPVYSYTRGTIVHATYEATNGYGQPEGEIGIRYGRNYLVKHVHITEIQPGVVIGQTIEAGVLIAYTEMMGGGSFWETEVCWLKSTHEIRALPLVFFLDAASQTVFNDILTAVGQSSWYHAVSEPTTESWVPYIGTHEAWADCSKFGVKPERTMDFDSPQEYYGAHGMSWIFN